MRVGRRSYLMNLESGVKALWVIMPNVAHGELFQVSQGSPEKTTSSIRASHVSSLLLRSPHFSSHASWAESFEIGSCPANFSNVHSCPQETLSTFGVLQTLEAQAAPLLSLPFNVATWGLWPLNISRLEIGTTHQVLQIPGVYVNLSESILKPLSLEWKREKRRGDYSIMPTLSEEVLTTALPPLYQSHIYKLRLSDDGSLTKWTKLVWHFTFNTRHRYQLLYEGVSPPPYCPLHILQLELTTPFSLLLQHLEQVLWCRPSYCTKVNYLYLYLPSLSDLRTPSFWHPQYVAQCIKPGW